MTAAELIAKLQKLDPDTVIVQPYQHGPNGWCDYHFLDVCNEKYLPSRQAFEVGKGKPDWDVASPRTRSKNTVKIAALY